MIKVVEALRTMRHEACRVATWDVMDPNEVHGDVHGPPFFLSRPPPGSGCTFGTATDSSSVFSNCPRSIMETETAA